MKKTWIVFMMVLVLVLGTAAACGSKKSEETNAVVGTFMEKKDFMFTVQDSHGKYYGFNFDVIMLSKIFLGIESNLQDIVKRRFVDSSN